MYINSEFNDLWKLPMTDKQNIDKQKRQTLKGIAAVAGATVAGSIPAFATTGRLTDNALIKGDKTVRQVWPPIAVKSQIELSTRVSATNNDIEVVLTNNSTQSVTMTQMSPSQLSTPRGTFNLEQVLEKGPRQLAAGESISIPMTHHAINGSANTLHQAMRTGLSITTDADQFAATSYAVVA